MTTILIFAISAALFLSFCIGAIIERASLMSHIILWLTTIVLSICTIYYSVTYNEPNALDVYRGKTELKCTVQSNGLIDSTVVYKHDKRRSN